VVTPGIEQRHQFTGAGVLNPATGTFPKRAGHTSQRKIPERCFTPLRDRNHMIDMKGCLL